MSTSAVLEYCVVQEGAEDKWGFRVKTSSGEVLAESPKAFESKAKAEEGVVDLIRSISSSRICRLLSELKTT